MAGAAYFTSNLDERHAAQEGRMKMKFTEFIAAATALPLIAPASTASFALLSALKSTVARPLSSSLTVQNVTVSGVLIDRKRSEVHRCRFLVLQHTPRRKLLWNVQLLHQSTNKQSRVHAKILGYDQQSDTRAQQGTHRSTH